MPNMTPIFSRSWLMKMSRGAGLAQRTGDLAKRLAHEASLQTDMAVSHLAFDFRLRHQRRD